MCFLIDMVNVSLELKDPKGKESTGSLARYDFQSAGLRLAADMTVTVSQTVHVFRFIGIRFSVEQRLQSGGSRPEVVCTVLLGWSTWCFFKV